MLNIIKNLFGKKSHVNPEGVRNNKNPCTYCGIELGSDRFSYHKGMHFHSKCIKKWYANNKRNIKNE